MDQDDLPPPDAAGLAAVMNDWITLWQSELAALMVDREMQEHAQALVDLWAGTAQACLRQAWAPQRGADTHHEQRPAGSTGATATQRAAATAAAPDDRDEEIRRLRARVAELEQRVAALERPRRRGKPAGPT